MLRDDLHDAADFLLRALDFLLVHSFRLLRTREFLRGFGQFRQSVSNGPADRLASLILFTQVLANCRPRLLARLD